MPSLIKAFIFLSDCNLNSGPHEYIAGTHKDFTLNSKRYYENEEVDAFKHSKNFVQSIVKAGTIVLEDTRGLHRAAMPEFGHRDLGYAVFTPIPWFQNYKFKNYSIRRETFNKLTPRKKRYIPKFFIGK